MIGTLGAAAASVLRRLDPERAHDAAVALLRHVPSWTAASDPPALALEAFGLSFPNPIGLAAGFDKNALAVDGAFALGIGHVEIGTLTPRPQRGNPRPRVFRLAVDRAIVNRYGFNNVGHAAAHARLASRRGTGRVGVNLGANKDSADRIADYTAGIACFADVADYFALNVSSPNTPGLRELQGAVALDDLLARCIAARDAVGTLGGRRPLLLKIAPDIDLPGLDALVRVARRRGVDGMIVANTTLARPPGLSGKAAEEAGGLSGRPLFAASTRLLAQTYQRVEGAFPLIGVGGVDTPSAAMAKIRAGARLIQVYSGLIYSGPALVSEIKRGLVTDLHRSGSTLLRETGTDADAWASDRAHDAML